MANVIPERGLNFKVYIDGSDMLGIAEGNFPQGDLLTSEVKGAGIAGTVETPVLGHMGSVTVTLNWRVLTKDVIKITQPGAHALDMYAVYESFDAGAGKVKTTNVHVFMNAVTKKYDMGKLTVGETWDCETEHEVYYYKVFIDGSEVMEVDKFNYVYKVNGVDYLAETRRGLGMM